MPDGITAYDKKYGASTAGLKPGERLTGAVGIKTGDTQAAGDCLLFEAVRGGESVIGVVLDDPSWTAATSDAENLLDYGFSSY